MEPSREGKSLKFAGEKSGTPIPAPALMDGTAISSQYYVWHLDDDLGLVERTNCYEIRAQPWSRLSAALFAFRVP